MRIAAVTFLFCWLPTSMGAQDAGAERLTLADAVARALTKNARVAAARDAIERARLDVSAANQEFRPNFTTSALGSFLQRDLANQNYGVAFAQRTRMGTQFRASVSAQTSRNQLGTYSFSDTSLVVSQPLLRGFGRDASRGSLDAAESRVRDTARERLVLEREVALEAAAAFYAIASRTALVDVAEKAVARAHGLYDESKAKLSAGRASQLDVLRAQQLVARADAERIDSMAALDTAKDTLRMLMNESPDFEFTIDSTLPSVPAPPPAHDAVALALEHRPDLATAADRVHDAERSVSAARSGLRPQLDLQLGVTRQSTGSDLWSSLGSQGFQLTSGLAASLPFNRTQQIANYELALLERNQRQRELETRRGAVVFETRRALREQQRAQLAVELALDAEELAQKEIDVARLRFDRGLASSLDIVAAESGFLNAQSRHIEAKAALVLARLALLAAMGTLDPASDLR